MVTQKIIDGFIATVMFVFVVLLGLSCVWVFVSGCSVAPLKNTNLYELHRETCELDYLNANGYRGADVIRQRDLQAQAYRFCDR